MIDNKTCKGNGKAIGYGCDSLVPVSLYGQSNRIYGLGKSCGCYGNWLMNSKEGKEKLNQSILKAKALEKVNEKKNLNQVKRDKLKNQKLQKKREIEGKDYQANTGEDDQKTVRRS